MKWYLFWDALTRNRTDGALVRWAQVPSVDFSPLGNLMQTYRDARIQGNTDRALSQIDPNNPQSLNTIGAMLMKAGNIPGGTAVTQLARQNSQDDWQRTYQGGMLKVAQQNANRQDTPAPLQILGGAGIDPRSPEGRKALFPKTDTPISATDKKAIFEAEDAQPQIKGTLEALARAKELNSQTFSGYGAGLRASIGSNLPDAIVPDFIADKKGAVATTEWQKIMGPEAVQTNGEHTQGCHH